MNYAEIISLALSYTDRTDADTVGKVDDFLKIVESRVNRVLKVGKASVILQIPCVTDQEYYPLPLDFSGMRDIEISNGELRSTMMYLSPERMNAVTSKPQRPTTIEQQKYYTIIANQIQIHPTQDESKFIEMVYYQNLTPLDSTNTNNWLSDYFPDAYVFGLNKEIASYAKDFEGAIGWDAVFKEALAEIKQEDKVDRWSGTPLQIRVDNGYFSG